MILIDWNKKILVRIGVGVALLFGASDSGAFEINTVTGATALAVPLGAHKTPPLTSCRCHPWRLPPPVG